MPFTPEEKKVLLEAHKKGKLSQEQKQEIIRRFQSEEQDDAMFSSSAKASFRAKAKPVLQAAGGMVGGVLGVPGGPAGILGGGALGTGIGHLGFENLENFLEFAGVFPSEPEPTATETIKETAGVMAEDAMFAGGFSAGAAGLKAIKPAIGKILGVRSQEAGKIIEDAKASGISLGAVDVAPGARGSATRIAVRTLGIFPFIGGPFRKSAVKKAGEVITSSDKIFNRLAPNAVLSDELSLDMVKAARGTQAEFRNVSAQLYSRFRNLAGKAGEVVPTDGIKRVARAFTARAEKGKIILENGEELTGKAADELADYMRMLAKLPKRINIQQFEQLSDQLESFVRTANIQGFDIKRVVKVKGAMERALSNLDLSKVSDDLAKDIRQSRESANSFYAKGIAAFQTPTGQKFGRVDKRIFKPGPVKPGTLNDDELAKVVINLDSPKAVRDLRSLVGDEQMGRAARMHLEKSWNDALILDKSGNTKGIDFEKLGKELGFGSNQERKAVFAELFKSKGIDINEVEKILRTAKQIEVPAEVNQFIARRAALGGLAAAGAAATVGKLFADSILQSVGVGLLLRYGARIVSDPKQLQALRRSIDSTVPVEQRRQAIGRLIEAVGNSLELEEEARKEQEKEMLRRDVESFTKTGRIPQ